MSITIKYRNVESDRSFQVTVSPHTVHPCGILTSAKISFYLFNTGLPVMFPDHRKLPHEQRLSHLRVWILVERRSRAGHWSLYNDKRNLSYTPWSFFSRVEDNTTRGHNWKLKKNHCRTDNRFHSSQRTVNLRNSLSHWCYGVKQLQKSARTKKSRDGLYQRLIVNQVLLAARPFINTRRTRNGTGCAMCSRTGELPG